MSIAREASESPNTPQSPPLVSAGSSDRCPACGAHLAVDQRYCVECGTRRGAPRFSLAGSSVGSSAASAASVPPPRASGWQRFMRPSSSVSLLLGLLILLVALGIGVLIGHSGNVKPTNGKVSVVVNGGGSSGSASSGTSTPASGTSNSTGSSAKATKASTKKSAAKKAATTPKAAAKIKKKAATAAKSFSSTATKKSTLGGSCQAGTAGCVNGKQTGNLF